MPIGDVGTQAVVCSVSADRWYVGTQAVVCSVSADRWYVFRPSNYSFYFLSFFFLSSLAHSLSEVGLSGSQVKENWSFLAHILQFQISDPLKIPENCYVSFKLQILKNLTEVD